MTSIKKFSQQTVDELNYYVYALVDLATNKICYIGKGNGQRIFQSLDNRSKKLNKTLSPYIIRHGLTEDQAFEIEATLIQLLPYFSFSDLPGNFQGGIHNEENGINSVEDIETKYAAPIISKNDFQHKVLIVIVNRSVDFRDTLMTSVKLYENTRKAWKISIEKAQEFDYVIASYHGLLKEIYKPEKWYDYPTDDGSKRSAFEGNIVTDAKIRELYLNKKLDERSYGSALIPIEKK